MGGTFDPIHIGHLILGESAYEQFGLDRVLFMPSGNPPHKTKRHGASNSERAEMVRLAIGNNPHFELSLEEMHEQGYIYTKETLRRLRMRNPDCRCPQTVQPESGYFFPHDPAVAFRGQKYPLLCNGSGCELHL